MGVDSGVAEDMGGIAETVIPQQVALPLTPAMRVCEAVIHAIRAFEADLDGDDEVAMGFAGGEAGVLRIEGLGCLAPEMVTFHGRDEAGRKMRLVQHVGQVSVVLRAVPKAEPEGPARRIGFQLQSVAQWDGGEGGDASADAGETG
ncbi:MAG: DUF6173 family protein [Paracoccaceae bacterium]